MTTLGKLIAGILSALIPELVKSVMTWVKGWLASRRERAEDEEANRRIREQTERAQTPKERDDAASETFRRGD